MAHTIYPRPIGRPSFSVSISVGGTIVLSAPTARLFKAHKFEWALLLYDRKHRGIALSPQRRKTDRRAYRITYRPTFRQAALSAKAFLEDFGWDRRGYHLDAHWDEENLLLEFAVPVWGSVRTKPVPLEFPGQAPAESDRGSFEMPYIVYERESWMSASPAVSISRGRIVINAAMARLFKAHKFECALLLVDEDQRKVSVFPRRRTRDKQARRIDYHPSLCEAGISAKALLKMLKWDGRKYHIDATWDEANSQLEFIVPDWRNVRTELGPVEVLRQTAG
jgi:hypothetical protein